MSANKKIDKIKLLRKANRTIKSTKNTSSTKKNNNGRRNQSTYDYLLEYEKELKDDDMA